MVKDYLLYGHGGSYNHGGEALVQSTVALLRNVSPGCKITLSSHFPAQDREFRMPVDYYVERNMAGTTNEEVYASTIEHITPDTVCIHLGGDNYCYNNWQRYAVIHKRALERGAKSILWSCSVEPDFMDAEMIEVFGTHHLICAREQLTYNALTGIGLTNVVKVSDIAFTLNPSVVPWAIDNFAVINFSPLILRKNPIVLSNFQELADYIINNTDLSVVLLPHVVQPADNDNDALSMIDSHGSKRVEVVSSKLSAAQYKHIISKARFCIAARTHVCIAAYSSCVPTLSIGYSSKSQGIAVDLEMSDYNLFIDEIVSNDTITDCFIRLQEDEQPIIYKLRKLISDYANNTIDDIVLEVLRGEG